MTGTDPRNRWIYHLTHVGNLPAVLAAGRLNCDAMARTRIDIGDVAIKQSRRTRAVDAGPGGCVGDYVPFYFAPRSPMMYRIARDHETAAPDRYGDGDRPLIYLVTTTGAIVDEGLTWVGTDGNAASAITRSCTSLVELDAMVDWQLMIETYWRNTLEDPDRQRRRSAEFLVHGAVPLPAIRWVGTYSDEYAGRVRGLLTGDALGDHVVRPNWYYGYERR